MASTKRRYSKEEFARRGDEVYEKQVLPRLKTEDDGKFAAIDIESGEYQIADEELEACDKLGARVPDAQVWLVRIGSRYVHRFGGREQRGSANGDRPCKNPNGTFFIFNENRALPAYPRLK